jgi:hypothetical protein
MAAIFINLSIYILHSSHVQAKKFYNLANRVVFSKKIKPHALLSFVSYLDITRGRVQFTEIWTSMFLLMS